MSLFKAERVVRIEAPPERVWELVGNPVNTPQWSPECRRVEWRDGATGPEVGAVFRGWNRVGPVVRWSLACRIGKHDPPKEMEFTTSFRGSEATTWSYRLEPTAVGTDLSLSCDSRGTGIGLFDRLYKMTGRQKMLERNLEQSLSRIKELAES